MGAAETLFRIGNRNAAYEAEQAVEQLVLAVAQSEGIHVERRLHHQLDQMVRLLPEGFAKERLNELTWLEAYATAYRSPKPSGGLPRAPDAEKLGGAIAGTRRLLRSLASHFGVDIAITAATPAAHARPPRREPERD